MSEEAKRPQPGETWRLHIRAAELPDKPCKCPIQLEEIDRHESLLVRALPPAQFKYCRRCGATSPQAEGDIVILCPLGPYPGHGNIRHVVPYTWLQPLDFVPPQEGRFR